MENVDGCNFPKNTAKLADFTNSLDFWIINVVFSYVIDFYTEVRCFVLFIAFLMILIGVVSNCQAADFNVNLYFNSL